MKLVWKRRAAALLAGALLQLVLSFAAHYAQATPEAGKAVAGITLVLPWWAHAVLIGSILWWAYLEEVFFRGWLWRQCEYRWGPQVAWPLTSLLFSGAHAILSWQEAVLLLPFSLVLGKWRHAYGPEEGLTLSAYCHVAFNSVGILTSIL